MVDEAPEFARDRFQNLKILGRPAETKINRRFIAHQCKRRGWSFCRIMGQKKIILPGVLEAADTEIAALIQGYSDAEISYYDESRIQINFAGHFSLMPRF